METSRIFFSIFLICRNQLVINFFFLEKKRYYVNDRYFDGSGPVFLMIGGEAAESSYWMTSGQCAEYAQSFLKYDLLIQIWIFCRKQN